MFQSFFGKVKKYWLFTKVFLRGGGGTRLHNKGREFAVVGVVYFQDGKMHLKFTNWLSVFSVELDLISNLYCTVRCTFALAH